MKKTAILLLILISTFSFNTKAQESFELFGSYQGMFEGIYLFADDHDEIIEFESCSEEVVSDFDLEGDLFNNHYFIVTYIILEKEKEGDSVDAYQIIKLEELDPENYRDDN